MMRLLAFLQLTRAALAFTAIADAWTVLLLYVPPAQVPRDLYHGYTMLGLKMLLVFILSACMYSFGMSLNDLLDARRDRLFAPRRPIPSGRIDIRTAIIVAVTLLMVALLIAAVIGVMDAYFFHSAFFFPWSFFIAFVTALLILFYDAAAKYLGGIGLLTLGLIRAFHCLVGNPTTPFLILSMFLLTHVTVISLIAYKLENKRPRLNWHDRAIALFGVCAGNGFALFLMWWRASLTREILPMLRGPSLAAVAYIIWAIIDVRIIHATTLSPREKGARLMLFGLFWLIIYDASILFANDQWRAGLAVAGLLLCAIASFYAMRFLSRTFMQPRPHYRIERTSGPEHA